MSEINLSMAKNIAATIISNAKKEQKRLKVSNFQAQNRPIYPLVDICCSEYDYFRETKNNSLPSLPELDKAAGDATTSGKSFSALEISEIIISGLVNV